MKLEITGIHENGKQESEYVHLKASQACNLQYYQVADNTYTSDGKISNKLRHVYWLAPKDVAKDDHIFLRTGKGSSTSFANKSGTTTHVLFWGLDAPVWNNDGDCAVLFEINTWKTTRA